MEVFKISIVLILLVTLCNGHLLDILSGTHERIHDTVSSVLSGGGHLNIQLGHHGHRRPPPKKPDQEVVVVIVDKEQDTADKPSTPGYGVQYQYGSNPNQYGTQSQSHFQSSFNVFGHHGASGGGGGYGQHGVSGGGGGYGQHGVSGGGGGYGQHGVSGGGGGSGGSGVFVVTSGGGYGVSGGSGGYGMSGGTGGYAVTSGSGGYAVSGGSGGGYAMSGGNGGYVVSGGSGGYGEQHGINNQKPNDCNCDQNHSGQDHTEINREPPKHEEKPGYGGYEEKPLSTQPPQHKEKPVYGGNSDKEPQNNNQGNYGGYKPTSNPPVTNKPNSNKKPSYGGSSGNYNTPEPSTDDGNLDDLIASVFSSEKPGTTAKDDDIPLFVPLNPNQLGYDNDSNKEPPKRETGEQKNPVDTDDMDFPIDIRFQDRQ